MTISVAVYPFKAFIAYFPNAPPPFETAAQQKIIFFLSIIFSSGFLFDFTFLVNGPVPFLSATVIWWFGSVDIAVGATYSVCCCCYYCCCSVDAFIPWYLLFPFSISVRFVHSFYKYFPYIDYVAAKTSVHSLAQSF